MSCRYFQRSPAQFHGQRGNPKNTFASTCRLSMDNPCTCATKQWTLPAQCPQPGWPWVGAKRLRTQCMQSFQQSATAQTLHLTAHHNKHMLLVKALIASPGGPAEKPLTRIAANATACHADTFSDRLRNSMVSEVIRKTHSRQHVGCPWTTPAPVPQNNGPFHLSLLNELTGGWAATAVKKSWAMVP